MKHDDCSRFADTLLNDNGSGLPPECRQHLETCEHCRQIHALDRKLEETLATALRPEPVSDHLLTMLEKNLESDRGRRGRIPVRPWFLVPVVALLGILLLLFLLPAQRQGLHSLDEIGRLAFADHHNIQATDFIPGTAGELSARLSRRLGFRVQVPAMLDRGYHLIGGRLCVLGRCNVAWLLYGHGTDRVSLFIINARDLTFPLSQPRKYILQYSANTVKIWKENDQVFALVD
ncbi:hypothetical protein ACLG6S_08230 [Thermodesulfobacteriota bacterium B35]